MSIDQSILSDVGPNATHARTIRALASAFVRQGGLVTASDLAISGDPVALAVNIAVGTALVPYRQAGQYYEPFNVDAPEQRAILSNSSGSTRHDLLYLGIRSKEFGDAVNSKDIYVKPGTPTLPAVDVMAATLPLGHIDVPNGAIHGSQCTFTPLLTTTAPVRDGGFKGGDLAAASPQLWAGELVNKTTGALGYGGYPHGAPFTPLFAILTPQFPNDSTQAGFGTFAPGVFHNDFCDATNIHGRWFDENGNPAPSGANFSAWYLCVGASGAID